MIKIRSAKSADKAEILSFCTNTFSWGDYIDQVWDYWLSNKKGGMLFVVQDGARKVAVSHVAFCPGGSRSAWFEGVRVHPDYRRSKIATKLIERMLAYAGKHGATQALAIVAKENIPSRRMMEKNGFTAISRWVYYSTERKFRPTKTKARLATVADLDKIWGYLQNSRIYRLSAGRYVSEWHWYPLDKRSLREIIYEKRVAVTYSCNNGSDKNIDGIVILNTNGYWTRTDVLQIVYLDSSSKRSLQNLLAFATNMYCGDTKYDVCMWCAMITRL
jgi:GNAT superfamily N-acetyltransferase